MSYVQLYILPNSEDKITKEEAKRVLENLVDVCEEHGLSPEEVAEVVRGVLFPEKESEREI